MKHERIQSSKRKAVNLSLDREIVDEAKEYGINISQACGRGLAAELKAEKTRRWKEENRAAIQSWNEWIEENGIPLAEYRQF